MTPHDALAAGDLDAALRLQRDAVAAAPADPAARLLLFELLTVAGRFRSAVAELVAIDSDALSWPDARRRFRDILVAESRRRRGRTPMLLSPARHARLRWRAIQAGESGDADRADRLLDAADAASPHLSGHVDGREFAGLRDSDDRFASVLEAFLGPRYAWVPLDALRGLTLLPVQGVLDAAFRPVRLHLADGTDLAAIAPMTYPLSHRAGGPFALGHDADWPDAGGWVRGVGARVWLTGDEELLPAETRRWEWATATL